MKMNKGFMLAESATHPGTWKGSRAFTMAEVLITLGVIGVIAALTMPTLIANYQKQRTITQLKKVYSILNQAYKLSEIENGDFDNWEDPDNSETTRLAYSEKYWKPYFNGAKNCTYYKDCGYGETNPWQSLAGGNKNDYGMSNEPSDTFSAYILSDGTFVNFRGKRGILVDLNNAKGPNIYGKDLFSFSVDNKGIVAGCGMRSAEFIEDRCTKESAACCTAKLINLDNWQIKDDYPW